MSERKPTAIEVMLGREEAFAQGVGHFQAERGEWAAEREALKQGLGSSVAVYRAALVRAGRIARDVLAEWTDPVSAESIGNAIAQRLKSEDEPR